MPLIEVIPTTVFVFDGRRSQTHTVVRDGIRLDRYASATLQVLLERAEHLSSGATMRAGVYSQQSSPDVSFVTGRSSASAWIPPGSNEPILLSAAIAEPFACESRAVISWTFDGKNEAAVEVTLRTLIRAETEGPLVATGVG